MSLLLVIVHSSNSKIIHPISFKFDMCIDNPRGVFQLKFGPHPCHIYIIRRLFKKLWANLFCVSKGVPIRVISLNVLVLIILLWNLEVMYLFLSFFAFAFSCTSFQYNVILPENVTYGDFLVLLIILIIYYLFMSYVNYKAINNSMHNVYIYIFVYFRVFCFNLVCMI